MKTNNTIANIAIQNLKRAQARKALASATTSNKESIWTPELWEEIDMLELSPENARVILADSAEKYPVMEEDVIDSDVELTVSVAPYDKRKKLPERARFAVGQKESTLDRIMRLALDAKTSIVKTAPVEEVEYRAYFGVRTASGVYRTGPQANVALAISKSIEAEPVIILVPVTDDDVAEM